MTVDYSKTSLLEKHDIKPIFIKQMVKTPELGLKYVKRMMDWQKRGKG